MYYNYQECHSTRQESSSSSLRATNIRVRQRRRMRLITTQGRNRQDVLILIPTTIPCINNVMLLLAIVVVCSCYNHLPSVVVDATITTTNLTFDDISSSSNNNKKQGTERTVIPIHHRAIQRIRNITQGLVLRKYEKHPTLIHHSSPRTNEEDDRNASESSSSSTTSSSSFVLLPDDLTTESIEEYNSMHYYLSSASSSLLLLQRLNPTAGAAQQQSSSLSSSSNNNNNNNNNVKNHLSFDLHPSEISIAERERRKHRRKLSVSSNVTGSSDDEVVYSSSSAAYQKNYAWMLEEDAFHEWQDGRKNMINNARRFANTRKRQKQRDDSANNDDDDDDDDDDGHINAVYATIPDRDDPLHRHDRQLHEFHAHRHLSRYEKQYRINNNIDLQRDWDGMYTFYNTNNNDDDIDDDDDDSIMEVEEEEEKNDEEEEEGQTEHEEEVVVAVEEQSRTILQNLIAAVTEHIHHGRRRELQQSSSSSEIPNWKRILTSVSNLEYQSMSNKYEGKNAVNYSDNNSNATIIYSASAEAAEIVGGLYDNYQQVPLSQGYGTHFANVWVGSPTPQRKTVIVDTGSHYTAFPCSGCNHCGAPHHTDPYYKPELSETFHQLQCNECKDEIGCDNGKCKFHQIYTEGSSWEAVQVRDRFYCGGADVLDSVNPDDQRHAIDFMFGCQVSMTGLFVTQLADGIMGMSAHPATLPQKLFDARKIEHNLFAMCYRRELGTSKRGVTAGSMTIGGVSNNLDTSPMVYAKNLAQVGWYTVYVKAIYIRSGGGQSARSDATENRNHRTIKVRVDPGALNSGKGVIVDSGTTDTYLNKKIAREFNRAWKQATGQAYTHSPMKLTLKQLHSLPTILVQCQAYSRDDDPSVETYDNIPGYAGKLDPKSPKDLLIAIPASSYMDYSPITKRYMSRLYFTESLGGVLGSNTMQGHNVLFDWHNGRVGFAESTCTYDKKKIPQSVMDDSFSTDCAVGNPTLTTACIETVDKIMCNDNNNPRNIALLGTETWTAVVKSTGNDAGRTCIQAAQGLNTEAAKTRRRRIQDTVFDPVVRCDGFGLCMEERSCQLTCMQAAEAAKVQPISSSTVKMEDKHQLVACGDSGWSACDYGCVQTRIQSQMFSDGICHEVSRESRPCHIGACARHDPCRVPFIVHVVLAFRNGEVSEWTINSKDILVTAVTETMNDKFNSRNTSNLFIEGDVHIVSAVPWYHDKFDDDNVDNLDDSADDSSSDPLGVKVVLEISMFNPFADVQRTSPFDRKDPNEVDPFTTIVQNFSDRVRGKKPAVTCRQDELYSLANHALTTKKLLLEEDVMRILIERMKTITERDRAAAAPFGPLFDLAYDIKQSRLLSVWTIRTGLEEEINYFGPQKSFASIVVAFVQNLVILLALFIGALVILNYLFAGYEYIVGNSYYWDTGSFVPMLTKRNLKGTEFSSSFHRNKMDEDIHNVEDIILMGNVETTNRQTKSSYKMSVAKKRFSQSPSNLPSFNER